MRFLIPFPAVAFLLFVLPSFSQGDELQTIAGKAIQGDLASVDRKAVVMKAPAGTVRTPIEEILQVLLQREVSIPADVKYTDIELVDGTLMHCSAFSLKGKVVEGKLAVSGLAVSMPLAAVNYLLNDAQDPAIRQEWQEKHLPRRGNQDLLAVKHNGVVNDLEGTFGDKESGKGLIGFEYGSGGSRSQRDIDLANGQVIQGVAFLHRAGAGLPQQLCKVYDVNQNVISAAEVRSSPKAFLVTSAAGLTVEYPRDGLARLDFNNDRLVYLSDLRAAEVVIRSRQGRADRLGIDRNLDNGPIQIEGQVYSKGLSVHAHTDLLYNLDGKYSKFEVVIGMDDAVGGSGRPALRIEADGKELFARTMTRKDRRQELSCNIKGAKQLHIVVSSSGPPGALDFGDHIDLANAKLSR